MVHTIHIHILYRYIGNTYYLNVHVYIYVYYMWKFAESRNLQCTLHCKFTMY